MSRQSATHARGSTSFQLTLSSGGMPTAFDCSNGMLCTASAACMTFYNLSNPVTPAHVIHYEPRRVDKVKMQKQGALIAALRGGAVSFWNSQSALSPLVGAIRGSTFLDMDWSPTSFNLLATGCSTGSVRIWDARAPSQSVQHMSVGGLQSCKSVQWCPSSPHLLAAASEGQVLLLDTRLVASKDSDGRAQRACVLEPVNGVRAMTWLSEARVGLCSHQGTLEYWNTDADPRSQLTASIGGPLGGPSTHIEPFNALLPTSAGAGVITGSASASGVELRLHGCNTTTSHGTLLHTIRASGIIGMTWGGTADQGRDADLFCITTRGSLVCLPVSKELVQQQCRTSSTAAAQPVEIPQPRLFGGRRLLAAPRLSASSLRPATALRSGIETTSGLPDASGGMFWARIEADALQLEDQVQQGELRGLHIEAIDQYARQVTLKLESQEGSLSGGDGRWLALISRFPARAPPTFATRGLDPSETAVGAALVLELEAIVQSLARGDERHAGSGLLLVVARTFREHCAHLLQKKADGLHGRSTAKQRASPLNVTDGLGQAIIDPKAYRVPCPAVGGARWSGSGSLLCFGGATVSFGSTLQPVAGKQAPRVYPKTLGGLYILERNRLEEGGGAGVTPLSTMDLESSSSSSSGSATSAEEEDDDELEGSAFLDTVLQPTAPTTLSLDAPLETYDETKGMGQKGRKSARTHNIQRALVVYAPLSTVPSRMADLLSLGPEENPAPLATLPVAHAIADLRSRIESCKVNGMAVLSPAARGYYTNAVSQVWVMLAVALDVCVASLDSPDGAPEGSSTLHWRSTTMGSKMVMRLLLFLVENRELQLLATMVCLLGGPSRVLELTKPAMESSTWRRFGKPGDLYVVLTTVLVHYSEVLSQWGQMQRALEVKRRLPPSRVQTVKCECSTSTCFRCGAEDAELRGDSGDHADTGSVGTNLTWRCASCLSATTYCSVCQQSMRGNGFFCMGCGHGGHMECLKLWAGSSDECATGCGCRCAELALTAQLEKLPGDAVHLITHASGLLRSRGSGASGSSSSGSESRSSSSGSESSSSSGDSSSDESDISQDGKVLKDVDEENLDLYSRYFGRSLGSGVLFT